MEWWTCPSKLRAIHTLISGKRNDVVDAGIVEVKRPRAIGVNQRKLNAPVPRLSAFVAKNLLHAAKDQFFGRTAFFCSARFQTAIDRVRYVDGSSHKTIIPYSWLEQVAWEPWRYAEGVNRHVTCGSAEGEVAGTQVGVEFVAAGATFLERAEQAAVAFAEGSRFEIAGEDGGVDVCVVGGGADFDA
jgi:hypothetical protein